MYLKNHSLRDAFSLKILAPPGCPVKNKGDCMTERGRFEFSKVIKRHKRHEYTDHLRETVSSSRPENQILSSNGEKPLNTSEPPHVWGNLETDRPRNAIQRNLYGNRGTRPWRAQAAHFGWGLASGPRPASCPEFPRIPPSS